MNSLSGSRNRNLMAITPFPAINEISGGDSRLELLSLSVRARPATNR